MTEQEKLKAITERIQTIEPKFLESYIMTMVIVGYLSALQKEGLIETIYGMTEIGKHVLAISEEFDLKPSDEQLFEFINEMIEKPDRVVILYMVCRYRDDREALLNEIKKFKESEEV